MAKDYRPGATIRKIAADEQFERHLKRLAESRLFRMERKVQAKISGIEYDECKELFGCGAF